MIKQRWSIALLLLCYWVLALWTSSQIPLFEAPDAYYHFAAIEHTARTGQLPSRENVSNQPWRQMAFHAPLYYEIAAALIRPIDTSDFLSMYPLNPHAQIGESHAVSNRNFVAHAGDPWSGTGLAVRIVRLFSMTLGMLTLIGVYAIARILIPTRFDIATYAVAVILFNPQFLFIHGVVTNDTLVTALTTLSLALLFQQMRSGITTRGVLILALLLALNTLAKASGLVLYPVIALGMVWASWRQRIAIQRVLLYAVIGIGMWLILAGWWYWNNWITLGDPTATYAVAAATHIRDGAIADLLSELGGMYYSFWGVFGWFNVLPPVGFYYGISVLIAASVVGALIGWYRHKFRISIEMGLMVLFVVIFALSWWRFHLLVNAAQGRLMFPLLGVIALLLGYGLAQFPRLIVLPLLGGLAVCAVLFPPLVIAPVYAININPPPVPANVTHLQFREPWKDEVCLDVWTVPAHWEENSVEIDVWWQAACPMTGYWSVFLHLVNLEAETCVPGITDFILAQSDTMPQGGNLPFPAMQPGTLYYDHFSLATPSDLDSNRDVYLGLYDAGGGTGTRAPVLSDEFSDAINTGKCAQDVIRYHLSAN